MKFAIASIFFLLPAFRMLAAPADTLREREYYRIEHVPIPKDVVLEVGGLAFNDQDELAVSTRRGEVWLIKNPNSPAPAYRLYAQGLHEPLGLAYKNNSYYLSQRGELTRLQDVNGDQRADVYQTIFSWPLSGNYHEYSYGPVMLPNGDMLVTLNLSWIGYGESLSKWRGWLLRITPEGKMEPIATGLRSPAGFVVNKNGDVFYSENQGDWVGSGRITHLEKGDFAGNPGGLMWTGEPEVPYRLKKLHRESIHPESGLTLYQYANLVDPVKAPTLWFPHTLMGISTSDMLIDTTGRFGPFKGQMFVGDQGHSKIMRVFMEEVEGVYQGACFPFREGFSSGVLRMVWGSDASMYVGMTARGWRSKGGAPYGLQRLVWTGKTPFEILEMKARNDGFELTFTQPVNETLASNPRIYRFQTFTYNYHETYGSQIIHKHPAFVTKAEVSADGLTVRLKVSGMKKGYIHSLELPELRSRTGESLLHPEAYYTLNQVPGKILKSPDAMDMLLDVERKTASSSKRINTMPAAWNSSADQSITIGTLPGLQYDVKEIRVKAGSKVALTFNNNDDMLHNIVFVVPGDAVDRVGKMAEGLGLEGMEQDYIPDTNLVLYHTGILQPESSETIYFKAPSRPGRYRYVCTFPGHSYVMRGTMIVE